MPRIPTNWRHGPKFSEAFRRKERLDLIWRNRLLDRCDYPLPSYLQPRFILNRHMSKRVVLSACVNARARSSRIPVSVN